LSAGSGGGDGGESCRRGRWRRRRSAQPAVSTPDRPHRCGASAAAAARGRTAGLSRTDTESKVQRAKTRCLRVRRLVCLYVCSTNRSLHRLAVGEAAMSRGTQEKPGPKTRSPLPTRRGTLHTRQRRQKVL
jgi:hypothetical protein